MLFNSEVYLAFLPIVVGVTWLLPSRARPVFLLVSSYIFYAAWSVPFLALIGGLTVVNYWLGIAQGDRSPRSRGLLVLAVACDLTALGVFKYLGLLDDTARRLAALLGLGLDVPTVQLILPLGLSFFTFEFIHYQMELWRGGEPIRSPVRFALFPAFFPTQIAGPIKRYHDFDAQVRSRLPFEPVLFLDGVELIVLGLFKKVVLADALLPIVQAVYGDPARASAVDAWTGLLAFSFQIYLDFSGYTDIGRGSAQLLGYRVPRNFDAPYLAASLRDFWRRWHMSLSSWLRDYLYISLGGNRGSTARTQFNLMVTMTLGGLWHGAAWHFVVWGFGHGLGLAIDRRWQELHLRPRLPAWVARAWPWLLTQLTVLLLWNVFRAPSLSVALVLWGRLVAGGPAPLLVTPMNAAYVVGVATAVLGVEVALRRLGVGAIPARVRSSMLARPAAVLSLAAVTAFFAVAGETQRFIYFQF